MMGGAQEISEHETEAEAREAGHDLLRLTGGMPPGWGLMIAGNQQQGFKLVKYPIGDVVAL